MAEPAEAERAKMDRRDAVQFVDLGTARREFISTVDTTSKYRNVTMEQIEAVREANKKGSAINRVAEANKSKLSAWNNAWKAVEGDVELENLDSMMNGQSHRAHLMDSIKQTGGQAYGKGAPSHTVTRVSKSLTGSGAAGRGAVGKPKRKDSSVLQSQPSRQSLDPAKDCNNRDSVTAGPSKKGKGSSAPAARHPQRPPTMKTRRAIALPTGVSYESMLVDSGAFMDAVSNAFPSRPAQRSTPKSESPCNNNTDRDKPSKIGPETSVTTEQKQVSAAVAPEPAPAPVAHNTTPPKSKAKIEVFSTPSTDGGTSAGNDVKKPRIGFNSSLPQPIALWATPAPEKATDGRANEPSLLDEGSAPTFSAAECLTAPKQPRPAVKESSASTTTAKHDNSQNNAPDLNAELEKLTRLLSNISLLPDDAVSYLKDRKEELESKLFKAPPTDKTEESRASIQAPAAARIVREEKNALGGISSHAGRSKATQERDLSKLPTTPAPPAKEVKEPKESKQPKEPKENKEASADSISDARRAAKPEYQGGIASQPPGVWSSVKETKDNGKNNLFDPQHIAKFGKDDSRSRSSRTGSDVNKGKEKIERKSYTDRRSSRGNRHSPKSLFFAKADDPFGPSTSPDKSNNEADNIIGEYLLPGRGNTKHPQPTTGKETKAENSNASKLEKKPPSDLQVSPTANSKSNSAPNFPISATTMQYYKGPLHPEMAPKSPSAGKASVPVSTSNSGTNTKPQASTAKDSQLTSQPKPTVSFELPSKPKNGMPENLPVSAATLQYYKGPISNTQTTSSDNRTAHAKSENKSTGAEIESTKHEPSSNQPSLSSTSDAPNFPITAATMQYAKKYFENNPNAKQVLSNDDGGPNTPSSRDGSSDRQRPIAQPKRHTVFSPEASPFNPNSSKKENSTPVAFETRSSGSTLFQERMEKKGVSVNRGNGLNASKYAF